MDNFCPLDLFLRGKTGIFFKFKPPHQNQLFIIQKLFSSMDDRNPVEYRVFEDQTCLDFESPTFLRILHNWILETYSRQRHFAHPTMHNLEKNFETECWKSSCFPSLPMSMSKGRRKSFLMNDVSEVRNWIQEYTFLTEINFFSISGRGGRRLKGWRRRWKSTTSSCAKVRVTAIHLRFNNLPLREGAMKKGRH